MLANRNSVSFVERDRSLLIEDLKAINIKDNVKKRERERKETVLQRTFI